jgi:DnaJ-class molecular chaperone
LEGTRAQELHPANSECPECKGKGEVPQHGGLRQKTCPRCNGRGRIKGPPGR